MSSSREKGLQIFQEVYGEAAADGFRKYLETDDFGVEQARWSADFAFGTVWAREGIERKMRSSAVLGMMIALRQYDEIRYHTKMGMANGLTKQEIEEILYTTVPYCGLPAANVAKAAMREAFRDLDEGKAG
jgi:alkylhydroperoxidase/carboxymuconolactone decarboxylase family protein YurZ